MRWVLLAIFLLAVVVVYLAAFDLNFNRDSIMSHSSTSCIRGACALVIFFDHLGLTLGTPLVLKPFTMVGYLCVSIFLFFSGYGLWGVSLKKNYLDKFLTRKLAKLLCPVAIAEIIYLLVLKTHIMYAWYIYVICGLYVWFYISNKMIFPTNKLVTIAMGICAYQLCCTVLAVPIVWYRACWAFFIGCFVYKYKAQIEEKVENHYKLLLLLNTIVFIIFFLLAALLDRFGIESAIVENLAEVLLYGISSVSCVLEVYMLTFRLNVTKVGKKLSKVGNIAYEIYLVHGFSLYFLFKYKELWFYPYITLVTTILLSLIIHTLSGKILKGLSIK